MIHVRLACCLAALLLGVLGAYEQPRPPYIEVEVTFVDPKSGAERTEAGQLWFSDFPRIDEHGRVRGFGGKGYYDGIKWFVPVEPGDIWLAKDTSSEDPRVFILKDYIEEAPITLGFHRLDVVRTEDSKAVEALASKGREIVAGVDKAQVKDDLKYLTMDGEKVADLGDEDLETYRTQEGTMTWNRQGKDVQVKDDGKPSPVKFATKEPIGVDAIPLAQLRKIVFLRAAEGMKREVYTGRYVQFSKEAKGDDGRVQIAAATFFGGPADERFDYGDFTTDDSILMGGSFHDLDFVDQRLIRVIGKDPPADAYPAHEVTDKKGRVSTVHPRRTGVMVHYSSDLRRLEEIIRLPWGVGQVHKFTAGPDDSLYVAGTAGPHFDTFAGEVGVSAVIENPEAIEASQKPDKKGRTRPLAEDGFVLKMEPGLKKVAWMVRLKHAGADIYLRPDGKLLLRRRDDLFFATPTGQVIAGPKLEITGSHMTVDPDTGDMYFGGSFRSATGLEPWVSPYLYKVQADGEIAWSAYSWSGPIVGVQQFRLVSDSSVSLVSIGEGGHLSFVGWSDGGNTVFTTQPYDMRKQVPSSGFCSSTWGATGGLTVRIANIVQLDPQTMEATGRTQYISYIPPSDVPTLLNIYAMETLPNGDIAVIGASWRGYVETWDAWTKPWYLEYRENPHAQAKSGTFFTLFRKGFGPPRMATRTPGRAGGKMAQKGNKLLIYSAGGGSKEGSPPTRWDPGLATHIVEAVQPVNGGGMDGYVMLVDTQGEARPPVVPEWSWDSPDAVRARQEAEKERKRKARVNIR